MNLLSRAIAALRPPISEHSEPIRIRTRGESLHRRFLKEPSFEVGSATIHGSFESKRSEDDQNIETMIDMDTACRMLERIDDARRAMLEHKGPASLRPVEVSFSAMDWGHVRHLSDDRETKGLNISMPFIVGGRWISHDVHALLDVASTIVVDMSMQTQRPIEYARIAEVAERVNPVLQALYLGDGDCGFHLNMPSPFGPSEIRRHDISSSPFEAFSLPDTKTFEDLTCAYEADGRISDRHMSLHVTRYRIFNRSLDIRSNEPWHLYETFKSLMRFDPRPLARDNPYSPSNQTIYLLRRGRHVLLVRHEGRDEFEFPGFIDPSWSDDDHREKRMQRESALLRSLGVTRTSDNWEHVATGTYIDEDVEMPEIRHNLQLLRFEGEPRASGDVTEIHWMDIDAPTRPMTFVTERLLLDQIRARMDKEDLT